MAREIDAAMSDDRPDKEFIRNMWADEYRDALYEHNAGAHPVYLTLPGAHARDIDVIVQRGFLKTAENGAVADEHLKRIVAIEYSKSAVVCLLDKYPGLTVIEQQLEDALESTSLIKWPSSDDEPRFRAQLVNLDLNSALGTEIQDGALVVPLMVLLAKLAQLHAERPRLAWTLCLTLNATISWSGGAFYQACGFLDEACGQEQRFRDGAEHLFGSELFGRLIAGKVRLGNLEVVDCQRFLMTFVPAYLGSQVVSQGWRVSTRRSLRYGGHDCTAPMVTWVIDFSFDTRANSRPAAVYCDGLATVFGGVASISPAGELRVEPP